MCNELPRRAKFMAKIRNLCSQISALINMKFIGVTCRPCGVKNIFGPLIKCNSGKAALRAGLSVKKFLNLA